MIFFMLEERKTIYLCLAHMSEAGFEQKQEFDESRLARQKKSLRLCAEFQIILLMEFFL